MSQDLLKHRRGSQKITLVGKDGNLLKNQEVTVKMTNHKFLFGATEFSAMELANNELQGEAKELTEERFRLFFQLFNYTTLPFYWGRFEPVKGKPELERTRKMAEWFRDKGVISKGHPLCWHTVTADWLMEMSNKDILTTQLNRIRRDVSYFDGLVDIWDVINEVVIMPIFDKYDNGITRICQELGRIRLVREVFAAAKKANPDATLLINDFWLDESYDILIEGLLEAGVPIDAIGIQTHMHQGYRGVEYMQELMHRYGRFKLPLHFTENSLVSGHIMPAEIVDLNDYVVDDWPSTPDGLVRQAEEMVTHYRSLFENPNVESITYWGFNDKGWLKAPSGLIFTDNKPKPSFEALHKLIKDEWWTKPQKLYTDIYGSITVEGFKGDYEAEFKGEVTRFRID